MLTRQLRERKCQCGRLVNFLVFGEKRIYVKVTSQSRTVLCLANSRNKIYLHVTTGTVNVHSP